MLLYVVCWLTTKPGPYALDPNDAGSGASRGRGTFEPHNKNYMEVARTVIGLASASIAAVVVLFFRTDRQLLGLQQRIALPLVFFAGSVVFGTAFVALLSWRYETYCHRPESYTRGWYCVIRSLGFSMLADLAIAYVVFVWAVLQS